MAPGESTMSTLKILAALLHYPDEELQGAAGELAGSIETDSLLPAALLDGVRRFIDRLQAVDLYDLQAEYVDTFDRGRARSLYIYEHLHGESRDRGQAMVELKRHYRRYGFVIHGPELPDYLPLFLEFLSSRPLDEALDWLGQVGEVLQLLHARLAERASPYALLLEPLARLGGEDTAEAGVRARVAQESADDTPAALDRAWMDAPVTFGPEIGTAAGLQQQLWSPQRQR